MTASESSTDRSKLTFSQAEGLAPLPSHLRLGEISGELRSVVWAHLVEQFKNTSYKNFRMRPVQGVGSPWSKILYDAHVRLYHRPADEFDISLEQTLRIYKDLIWEGRYNMIFDFIQFVMRHPARPYDYPSDIGRILKQCRAAYTVMDGATIIPIGSEEEVKALVSAFAATEHEEFPGAGAHLRLAVEALNSGRYGDSVRESVHAVESAARVLSDNAKATLGPALQQLDTRVKMHPAFRKALESLYGYTSDEGGIRHSLLADEAHVDMHDALFMLGACASFVTFLIGKARGAGMISE